MLDTSIFLEVVIMLDPVAKDTIPEATRHMFYEKCLTLRFLVSSLNQETHEYHDTPSDKRSALRFLFYLGIRVAPPFTKSTNK